jgi:ABC-type glycerol-3-phosphate transport system substrate-binding protein
MMMRTTGLAALAVVACTAGGCGSEAPTTSAAPPGATAAAVPAAARDKKNAQHPDVKPREFEQQEAWCNAA